MSQCSECGGGGVIGSALPCPACAPAPGASPTPPPVSAPSTSGRAPVPTPKTPPAPAPSLPASPPSTPSGASFAPAGEGSASKAASGPRTSPRPQGPGRAGKERSPVPLPSTQPRPEGVGRLEHAGKQAGEIGTKAAIDKAETAPTPVGAAMQAAKNTPVVNKAYNKLKQKVVDKGGEAGAKGARVTKSAWKLIAAIIALVTLLLSTLVGLSPAAADEVLPPKPSEAQCSALPQGWCEVAWVAQEQSRNTGGEPVPWPMIAGLAKTTSDFGRYSPNDTIDRDPGRTLGGNADTSDTASTTRTQMKLSVVGDSLTALPGGYTKYLKKDSRVNVVNVDSVVGRGIDATNQSIADGAAGKDEHGHDAGGQAKTSIADNVLVDIGTNDAPDVGAYVHHFKRTLALLTPAREVFWASLHSVGPVAGTPAKKREKNAKKINAAVRELEKAYPNLHVVDTGEQVWANPGWLNSDSAMKLHPFAGYKKRAKLVVDSVYEHGDDGSSSNTTPANVGADIGARKGAAAPGAPSATGTDRFYPVKTFKYSNPFKNPGSYGCGFHTGIDVSVSYQPVYAVSTGIIASTGSSGPYGNSVVLRVGDVDFRYAHLASIGVSKGQKVAGGQQLGKSGNTGNSTGPHLHFEMMKAKTGYQCDAFSDPVAWLKGSEKPSGAGTPAADGDDPTMNAAFTNNTPAKIEDTPSWANNLSSLNTVEPGDDGGCPVATPSPAIEGANGSQGALLLSASASDELRGKGQDPNNVCQAVMFLVSHMRFSEELGKAAETHDERFETPEKFAAYWTDALNRSGLVVSPTADDSNCTKLPAGLNNAEKISWAVSCQVASRKNGIELVTDYSDNEPTIVQGPDAAARLADEAISVAAIYSRLGEAACNDGAAHAGVFPLTAANMANTKVGDLDNLDRCDAEDNILVAAKMLVDGEAEPVKKRSTSQGKFAPMLGGWAAMPWVMNGTTAAFAKAGPIQPWNPNNECVAVMQAWVVEKTAAGSPLNNNALVNNPAALNTLISGAPAKDPRCGAPSDVVFYQGLAHIIGQGPDEASPAGAGSAGAYANLRTWVDAKQTVTAGPAVQRLSVDGSFVQVPANVDMFADPAKVPNPLGLADKVAEVVKYAVDLGGAPKDGQWLALKAVAASTVDGCSVDGASMTGALPVSSKKSVNEKTVWQYFTTLGFSPEGIAGIVGNLVAESGINPRMKESGGAGPGRGIMQWGFNGGAHGSNRFNSLIKWAKANGKSEWDIGTQLEWMTKELKAYNQYGPMKKQTNVVDAMYLFGRKMEAPNEAYAHWEWRVKAAKESYAKFAPKQATLGGAVGGAAPAISGAVAVGNASCGAAVTASSDLLETYARKMESYVGKSTMSYGGSSWNVDHMCLRNVETIWAMIGGKRDGKYVMKPTAWTSGAMLKADGKLHPYNRKEGIPRGMLVFWDLNVGGGAGHVAISDGKGNSVNNYGSNVIKRVRLTSQETGLRGWAEPTAFGKPPKGLQTAPKA